jgi:hypothetical protein
MKANLIVKTCEVTIRDYSLLEDEGIGNIVNGNQEWGLSHTYEEDPESSTGHAIVIRGQSLERILDFLDFSEIRVMVIA